MDTQQTIQTIEVLSKNIKSEVAGKLAQADAMDLAVSQLKGILVVQADALEKTYKDTIDNLTGQKTVLETTLADKSIELDTVKSERDSLKAELEAEKKKNTDISDAITDIVQ